MKCPNDTDGDGDCEMCCWQGGCFRKKCQYCHRPIPEPTGVCDRESCQRFERELLASIEEHERQKFKAGLKAALQQRCKPDEDWSLNRLQRWLYTIKLLLCMLLRLHYRGDEVFPDCVVVGLFDEDENDWSEYYCNMQVGRGFVCGWWWDYGP